MLHTGKSGDLNANSYVRMMPHTAAANVGIFFGLTGRIIPTSSACTSGSQGIGFAYEAIRAGRQTMMLAGWRRGTVSQRGYCLRHSLRGKPSQ